MHTQGNEEARTPPQSSNSKKSKKSSKRASEKVLRHPEWLMDTVPRKTPYFPQIGDEVVYFHQGHQSYVQAVKRCRVYHVRDQAAALGASPAQGQWLLAVF
ncbi:hypothetical protein HPB51_015937 [Rhipicephalus microplus]|uniref:BRWD/PHIP ancillary-like domain-containing protein n=1 Tax=Rhipicephalus microplus TaxID=6941 RepID=A0A9J6DHA5_RHIMP|nr:hypothetical protein HPB51_015937 [Rhipicephalus microplus]